MSHHWHVRLQPTGSEVGNLPLKHGTTRSSFELGYISTVINPRQGHRKLHEVSHGLFEYYRDVWSPLSFSRAIVGTRRPLGINRRPLLFTRTFAWRERILANRWKWKINKSESGKQIFCAKARSKEGRLLNDFDHGISSNH